jgi:hypothetical protein
MTTTQEHYVTTDDFREHIQDVALKLFNENEVNPPGDNASPLSMLEFDSRQEEVFDRAYLEKPEVFKGINWINSELGLPLWVRPGVEWEID